MAKKKSTKESFTLGEAIKSLKIGNEDVVFLHTYEKDGDEAIKAGELDAKALKRRIMVVQPHFGGIEHEYNCYRFVLEK